MASLYLLVDAVTVVLLRPFVRWVARVSERLRITAWIRSLGPYSSLALFLVPLVVLEPVKPVSVFLMGTGHPTAGLFVLVIGEAAKIVFLERIFQVTRPKLMSFRWFAFAYDKIQKIFSYLMSLTIVKIARAWMRRLRAYARRLVYLLRAKPT